ncbi:polysaccharide biosynthesis/export family protein [Lacibacterium aquatile]|uniref:Polysaccharide biosynthesis/export family protein n=1 Tax=Lacibacterium aquatile TaxID=1168082 RepID=A0ABW5DUS1_9PROT
MNAKALPLLALLTAVTVSVPASAQQWLETLGVQNRQVVVPPNSSEPVAGQRDQVLSAPPPLGTAPPVQQFAPQQRRPASGFQPQQESESFTPSAPSALRNGSEFLRGEPIPFGANLFLGRMASEGINSNPNYLIGPGDTVSLVLWGGESEQQFTSVVDQSGNMFLPNIGPVKAAGLRAGQLQGFLDRQVQTAYTGKVKIYGVVQGQYRMGVFVAGFVRQPGRYNGGGNDSVLDYLLRAGGIDITRGSFRDITVFRGKKVIATADLYDFLLNGQLPTFNFEEGDRIVVGRQRPLVQAEGAVRNNFLFEQPPEMFRGLDLLDYARPLPQVTHVAVSGSRNMQPFSRYMTLNEFAAFELRDQDKVAFTADTAPTQVTVRVEGSRLGPSILVADRSATLSQVLNYVSVDPNIADLSALYIRRRSAAEQQRRSINDSLDRLERQLFTASSSTDGVAQIRASEAKLVGEFISRARRVEPDGRIVVRPTDKALLDVRMEDGDVIVIPERAQTILVTGEVLIPQTVVFQQGLRLSDYVKMAGGYTDRADEGAVMIRRLNGEVLLNADDIRAGDEIVVVPEVDSKLLQISKEILQSAYLIVLGASRFYN